MLRYLSDSTSQTCTTQWPSSMSVYKYCWKKTFQILKIKIFLRSKIERENRCVWLAELKVTFEYLTEMTGCIIRQFSWFWEFSPYQPFNLIISVNKPLINKVKVVWNCKSLFLYGNIYFYAMMIANEGCKSLKTNLLVTLADQACSQSQTANATWL